MVKEGKQKNKKRTAQHSNTAYKKTKKPKYKKKKKQ